MVGDITDSLKNDLSDYSYYTDNINETENTSANCTENMHNCTKHGYDGKMIQQTDGEAETEDEGVTETNGANDSKTNTFTLLDFSNYLIPNEENSENVE